MLLRAILLLLVLALPQAASAMGQEEGLESVELPAFTRLEGPSLAIYLDGYESLSVRSFWLAAAEVEIFEGRQHTFDLPGAPEMRYPSDFHHSHATYTLHDVRMNLTGVSTPGYFGVHPGEGVTASVTPSLPTVVQASERTEYARGQPSTDLLPEDPRAQNRYTRIVEGPHLTLRSNGVLRYEGPARIHLSGIHLEVLARENVSTLRTGESRYSEGVVVHKETRWLVLDAPHVVFEMAADSPLQVGLSEARTDDLVITPDGVVMLPRRVSPQSAAPVQAGPGATLLAVPLVLGAAVLVAGGALYARARGRRPASAVNDPTEAWDPEDCMRRAALHLEGGRDERALEWTQRARALAPTSSLACAIEALLLERLGRLDEALAGYAQASELSPEEGEHDLCAARLAARAGRPDEEVDRYLERALGRTPSLVEELEQTPELADHLDCPPVAAAMQRAWSEHARDLSTEEDDADVAVDLAGRDDEGSDDEDGDEDPRAA